MTGLYLHIPFCLRKCPYCDFFSVVDRPEAITDYVQWLDTDLRQAAGAWPAPVETVYFGGGTPSLLQPEQVGALLERIGQTFGLAADAEVTIEANPGTLDRAKLDGFRRVGVNRLSLGLQSLNDARLATLGRLHDAAAGMQALHAARDVGFDNISCDLMFALPGESSQELFGDLQQLLAVAPEHVAVYGLTIEPGTRFATVEQQGMLALPDEEAYVAAYRGLHERLTGAGYEHYEISNFARPGRRSRHNQRYWRRQNVLGVGAGAHSFHSAGWGSRAAVPNELADWRRALRAGENPAHEVERFDLRGAMIETLYLGLRTRDGVDDERFAARFGLGVEAAFPEAVERCRPYLAKVDGFWRFDLDGWLLFNTLVLHFF